MGNGFRQSFLLHVLKRTPRATSANTVAKRIRRAFIIVTTPAATSDNSKRSGKLLAEFSVIRSSRVFGFVNSGATVAAKFLRYSRASLRSSRNRQTSSGCATRGYLDESNDEDSGSEDHTPTLFRNCVSPWRSFSRKSKNSSRSCHPSNSISRTSVGEVFHF